MATIKDKIGLAMLPSAQSGGASTSTTDFSGTVHSLLPIQYTSANLLTNGGFDQDSAWTKQTGWSIKNGVATRSGAVSNSYIGQTLSLESGKTYKFVFNVISITGTGTVYTPSTAETILTYTTTGEKVAYFTPSNTQDYILGWYGIGNAELTIDNISVQLISNGDFKFERSSSATRVGSDGYIKNVEVLSDELVQNRDFEEVGSELAPLEAYDTNFSANPSSGTVTEENGVLTAVGAVSVGTAVQITNRNITVGKIYKVSFSISNYVSGNFALSVGNQYSPDSTGDGDFEYYIKYTSGIDRFYFKFGDFTGTVSNASVKQVGQNWTFNTSADSIYNDNGNLKARINGASGLISQGSVVEASKKYRASFNLKYISGIGAIKFQVGGFDSGFIAANLGEDNSYSYDFTTTSTGSVAFRSGGNAIEGLIDNVSVVEVTDDTDIPRLDFSNAAQPSLLLEPTRINYIHYSESFPQNGNNISKTLNALASPDNKNNALKIEATATSQPSYQTAQADIPHGATVVQSGFFKKGNTPWVGIGYFDTLFAADSNNYVRVNLDTLDTSISGSNYSDAKAELYPNGWVRLSAKITIPASGGSNSGFKYMLMKSDDFDDANIGDYCYIWGLQAEGGNYLTSYIPTNGENGTRNADVCNNAGDSTIFNDAEGVLFVEINKPTLNPDDYWLISVNDNSASNTVAIGWTNGGDELFARVIANGVVPVSYISGEHLAGEYYKIALKYKSGDSSVWVNGEKVHPDLDTFSFTNSLRSINFDYGNGNNDFRGGVRQLLYFNEALSDAELERLTSSDITQVLRNYNRRGELLGATYESTHVQTKLNELF